MAGTGAGTAGDCAGEGDDGAGAVQPQSRRTDAQQRMRIQQTRDFMTGIGGVGTISVTDLEIRCKKEIKTELF